jgi:hypothetical protein
MYLLPNSEHPPERIFNLWSLRGICLGSFNAHEAGLCWKFIVYFPCSSVLSYFIVFFSKKCRPALGGPQGLFEGQPFTPFQCQKKKITNKWGWNCTPPICLYGLYRNKYLPLPLAQPRSSDLQYLSMPRIF